MDEKLTEASASSLEINTDKFKLKGGIFLVTVSGISALIGFSATLAAAKKQDAAYFNKGIAASEMHQIAGVNLAIRALGWGTLYAVCGTSMLFYSIWKLSGAKNFEEFRYKMGSVLPKIPKNELPSSRTEFEGLTDLLEYLQTRK